MSIINSRSLLRRAHTELDGAHKQSSPREQFLHAHMAALRGAAAVLALGTPAPAPRRRRSLSAWIRLAELGEQWAPWVEYYTASADTRAALESGQLRTVESDQARQAIRVAGQFLNVVEGVVSQSEAEFSTLARAS